MSLPTRNQINKQIKFIVILSLIFISVNYGPSTFARWGIYNSVVVANNLSNVANDVVKSNTSEITQNQGEGDKGDSIRNKSGDRESLKPYPQTKKERHDWILDYLSWEHPELSGEEINNLMLILEQENSTFNPYLGSKNLTKWGEQDGYGIGQILNSTWKLKPYGCKGSLYEADVKTQLDCIASIQKVSGYGAWWTSAHDKLHII